MKYGDVERPLHIFFVSQPRAISYGNLKVEICTFKQVKT